MKLLRMLEVINQWPQEWDPEQPGLTKHTKGFYKAFYYQLKQRIKELEKTLDDVRWTQVS